VWRDRRVVDGRDQHARIRDLARVAAVAADDPTIAAPRSRGSFNAETRFGLMFLARLPPPTENTNRPSSARSRLQRSHSTNTLAQPSSLVRAVSSETLSVGA
jgi:hypothetical protein